MPTTPFGGLEVSMHLRTTEYGFEWGSAQVTRIHGDERVHTGPQTSRRRPTIRPDGGL